MVFDTPAAKKSQKKHYKNEMSPPKLDSGCLARPISKSGLCPKLALRVDLPPGVIAVQIMPKLQVSLRA
jgi:hypothetical protein